MYYYYYYYYDYYHYYYYYYHYYHTHIVHNSIYTGLKVVLVQVRFFRNIHMDARAHTPHPDGSLRKWDPQPPLKSWLSVINRTRYYYPKGSYVPV